MPPATSMRHLVLDSVRRAQDLGSRDPGIPGGIAGSDRRGAVPALRAAELGHKFTIDAFLEEARIAAAARGQSG
jgi:hypothetical protein